MGDRAASSRDKSNSYDQLDAPGEEPIAGAAPAPARYDESVARTEHITLDELEPVESEWEAGRQATELVGLEELEEVDLEPLDPKDANAPPALPDVGLRAHAPTPPLPVTRPAPKAKKVSTPPPPPPTRAESLKEAPKPMIGGEGWEPEGPISIVDFSAVLTAPRRRSEPPPEGETVVPGFSPSSPLLPSALRPREPSGGSGGWARALLLTLVVVGVGVGAYLLGRQEVLGGTEIAEAESPTERAAVEEEVQPTPGAEVGSASEDDAEPETNEASEANEAPAEPAAAAMTETPTVVMEPTRREAPSRMVDSPSPRSAMSTTTSAARAERPTTMSTTASESPREPSTEPTAMTAGEPSPLTAATMTPRTVEPEAAPSDLPASPSREQVQAALDGVRPQVAACLEGQHATVRVRVTVRGSGRVTTAQVEDSTWARPPHGSCIARAVRHARFPQFADESFVVLYPFQI